MRFLISDFLCTDITPLPLVAKKRSAQPNPSESRRRLRQLEAARCEGFIFASHVAEDHPTNPRPSADMQKAMSCGNLTKLLELTSLQGQAAERLAEMAHTLVTPG